MLNNKIYTVEIEFLNINDCIETLIYTNVSYVCFKYFDVSIFLLDTKQLLKFQNVVSIHIFEV